MLLSFFFLLDLIWWLLFLFVSECVRENRFVNIAYLVHYLIFVRSSLLIHRFIILLFVLVVDVDVVVVVVDVIPIFLS